LGPCLLRVLAPVGAVLVALGIWLIVSGDPGGGVLIVVLGIADLGMFGIMLSVVKGNSKM
jgi:hypothetical protein